MEAAHGGDHPQVQEGEGASRDGDQRAGALDASWVKILTLEHRIQSCPFYKYLARVVVNAPRAIPPESKLLVRCTCWPQSLIYGLGFGALNLGGISFRGD